MPAKNTPRVGPKRRIRAMSYDRQNDHRRTRRPLHLAWPTL